MSGLIRPHLLRSLSVVCLVVAAHLALLAGISAPDRATQAQLPVTPVVMARTLQAPVTTSVKQPSPADTTVTPPATSTPKQSSPKQAPPRQSPPVPAPRKQSVPQPKPAVNALPAPTPSPVLTQTKPAAPPQAVALAQPPVQPVVEARFDADYLRNPSPEYPYAARRRQQQGTVLLEVRVEATGKASRVDIQTSSGFSSLDESALRAVRQWTFVPAHRGDTPVASTVRVPILFRMQ